MEWYSIDCIPEVPPGRYSISSTNQIRDNERGCILKPYVCRNGSLGISLRGYNRKFNTFIHKIYARMFIPNPNNCMYLIARNGNYQDIRADNLIWTKSFRTVAVLPHIIKERFETIKKYVYGVSYTDEQISKITGIKINTVIRFRMIVQHMLDNHMDLDSELIVSDFVPIKYNGKIYTDHQVNRFGFIQRYDEKIIEPYLVTGYPSFSPRWNNENRYHPLIHRIVAQTFLPNPENKSQVNHINGIRLDCCVWNLEWTTPLENTRHSIQNGLTPLGERNSRAKHTDQDARNVCEMLMDPNNTPAMIMNKLGVDKCFLDNIRLGISWGHISKDYPFKYCVYNPKGLRYIDENKTKNIREKILKPYIDYKINSEAKCR